MKARTWKRRRPQGVVKPLTPRQRGIRKRRQARARANERKWQTKEKARRREERKIYMRLLEALESIARSLETAAGKAARTRRKAPRKRR